MRPKNNVPTLDVLRSLAILLVFSGHFAFEFGASPAVQRFPLTFFGWTGVDLFFVLSGLLIGSQLWRELRKTGEIRIGTFLLRRGLRIWPLYFAFVLLIVVEAVFFGRDSTGLWSDILMLSNYFRHQIGGGWSLSTEEQFYVTLPVSLALFSRWMKPRNLIWLAATAMLVLPVLRALTIRYSGLSLIEARDYMYSPFHTHSDGLALGVLIAWVTVYRMDLVQSPSKRLIIAALMLSTGMALYVVNREVFKYSSLALIFGAAVWLGLSIGNANPVVNWHGFYLISRLSYGIYLNHFGLLPIAVRWVKFLHPYGAVGYWLGYTAAFLVCALFATLTFAFVEWPFLQIRERWLEARRQPAHPRVSVAVT